MKKFFISTIFTGLIILFCASVTFAENTVPFVYNVIAEDKNESIIDKENQKELVFNLYENEGTITYNGNQLEIKDYSFKVDISSLEGKQTFKFINDMSEEISFTYYISGDDGLIKDYNFLDIKNVKTYVKTINNVKITYTNKDAKKIDTVIKCLEAMPTQTKTNLKEIILVPAKHASGASGITSNNIITLYNISKYSTKTIQNIVFHEIAHTWAFKLIQLKEIDFSYTNYSESAKQDKKFVSSYSKKAVKQNDDYSEDFAEAVAFYFMNTKSFAKKFPARTSYIQKLLDIVA